ncbi:MAG: hypothetical protein C0607_08815 [Azoarcus sp.]|nr:MAG: hypothetical protein C0607_08815 [Azoarcus sp.]
MRAPSEIAALAFDAPKVIAMPMSELGQRFRALPRDQALNVASSAGERSVKATCFQMFPGYEKVANMEDGVTEWGRKGFPGAGRCVIAGQQFGLLRSVVTFRKMLLN